MMYQLPPRIVKGQGHFLSTPTHRFLFCEGDGFHERGRQTTPCIYPAACQDSLV